MTRVPYIDGKMDGWMDDDRTDNYQTEGLDVRCITCIRDDSAIKTVFQMSLLTLFSSTFTFKTVKLYFVTSIYVFVKV